MRRLIAILVLASAPLVARADDAAKTERLWKAKCASCHGVDGKGQTEQGKKMKMHDLSTADWQKSFTDAQIKQVTLDGIDAQKEGVHKQMDPYKEKLKPDQVDALTAFVRTLGSK